MFDKKIALKMKIILKNEQFRNTIDFLYKKYCKYTFQKLIFFIKDKKQ